MEIEWPEEPPTPARRARSRPAQVTTAYGTLVTVRDSDFPSARNPRDVMIALAFVALIVVLGVCLLVFGPLPRVFPELPNGGAYVPR
jgi:hypothetical protein